MAWPLLFPEKLDGTSQMLGLGVLLVVICYLSFGAGGFILTYKFTKRFVKDDGSVTKLFS